MIGQLVEVVAVELPKLELAVKEIVIIAGIDHALLVEHADLAGHRLQGPPNAATKEIADTQRGRLIEDHVIAELLASRDIAGGLLDRLNVYLIRDRPEPTYGRIRQRT